MFALYYAKYYDILNSGKPYHKDCNFIYNWAGKPKMMLDIGCGTANYWKHFPKGTEIIGIEKSYDMISYSKYRDSIIENDIKDVIFIVAYDCVTALFDVINYIPNHSWWKDMPLQKGGNFIFDIWDKKKVDKDGFKETIKGKESILRTICPLKYENGIVKLKITIAGKRFEETEYHEMYVYSEEDIEKFCGNAFEITGKKETKGWQTWYRLQRK